MRSGQWVARVRSTAVILLFFVGAGVVVLLLQLQEWWEAAVIVPVVVLFVLRVFPVPDPLRKIGIWVGAFVYPLLGAVGFAWAWAWVGIPRPEPEFSVPIGAAVLAVAVWWYVRPWWLREPSKRPWHWVVAVIVLLIVLPIAVATGLAIKSGDEDKLDADLVAVSSLNAVVLRPGADAQRSEEKDVNGWRVHTWTGAVGPGGVTWGPDGPPPFVPADDVDTVLLLMPGADADENPRAWLEDAAEFTAASTPAFALLETDDEAVLARWRNEIRASGGVVTRRGDAHPLDDLTAQGATVTDIALRLGALSRDSDQELALAAKHRPALFFDNEEEDHTPLNIDTLLASGKMSLCERGQAVQPLCTSIHSSVELHNGAKNVAFDPDELAKETRGSTIYVNVRRTGNDHRNTIYLDYWWYLAHNPTGAAAGALCGPGFVIAGVTCFDHQSDWEGVTVILDADTRPPAPTAVTYGQHNHEVRYTWDALQESWDRNGEKSLRRRFGEGINTRARPLVFVARGTHASYPRTCDADRCRAGGIVGLGLPNVSVENSHDGGRAWRGNYEDRCRRLCLTAFPTRAGGGKPARWNAFEGRWGTSTCIFGLDQVCTGSNPPRSPGFQDRFKYPWCKDWVFSFSGGEPKRTEYDGCPDLEETEDALLSGERLLALGDSFSSGQGAGSYHPGTNRPGVNTCYRSPLAWPQRLAERLELRRLPSLACSGARMRQVTDDSTRGEEERRHSQVGRISRDPARVPDVITLTIGGNDAGFADVLGTCIAVNCVRLYDRRSGDELERRARVVGGQLPDVYGAIRRAAPDAALVVVGYPRLFPEGKPGGEESNCAAWDQISAEEARYLNDNTRVLNAQIAAAAAAVEGTYFVDVTEAFDGRELRCEGETYVNRFRAQSSLLPASFHPNAAGHERLAEVVEKAVRAIRR